MLYPTAKLWPALSVLLKRLAHILHLGFEQRSVLNITPLPQDSQALYAVIPVNINSCKWCKGKSAGYHLRVYQGIWFGLGFREGLSEEITFKIRLTRWIGFIHGKERGMGVPKKITFWNPWGEKEFGGLDWMKGSLVEVQWARKGHEEEFRGGCSPDLQTLPKIVYIILNPIGRYWVLTRETVPGLCFRNLT